MKRNLTDQEIDKLMQSVVCDGAADEEELRSIAESPTVWWAVQREIAKGSEVRSPWPPSKTVRRWLMILAPTAVAAALLIALFVVFPVAREDRGKPIAAAPVVTPAEPENRITDSSLPAPVSPAAVATSKASFRARRIRATQPIRATHVAKSTPRTTEIKSEFIALSYASTPASGQVVRVKVPRSMMVTLGLVASVETPTKLVDAEVLVGDDGLTRSIRFIQ